MFSLPRTEAVSLRAAKPMHGQQTDALAVIVQSLFVLLFPLQWITVVDAGGFALKVAHVAVIGLSLLAWVSAATGKLGWRLNPFYSLFFVILVIQICSLAHSQDAASGLSAIMRSFAYVFISLGIYFWFLNLEMNRYASLFSNVFPVAIIILYTIIIYSFFAAGQNFFEVVTESILSGNPNALQYRVFYKLFNDYSLAASDMEDYSSAARHTIALSIIFLSIMAVAGLRRVTVQLRWLVYACIAAVFFFVAISMSRSAVFSILVPLAFLLHAVLLRRPGPLVLVSLAAVLAVFAVVSFASSGTVSGGFTDVIQGKFVDDIVDNPRARDFGYVIDSISENPWLGAGIGTPVPGMFVRSEEVHNFFLHLWHGAGIVGAIAGLALGGYLVWALFNAYRMGLRARGFETICIHLIVVYALSSSFLRLSVAGSGDISLSEWCMLAIGLAFYDRLRGYSSVRPAPSSRPERAVTA